MALLGLVLLFPRASRAQMQGDSLSYYYNALLHPQNPEDLPDGIAFYTRRKSTLLRRNDTLGAIESLRMIAIGQFKIGMVYESEGTIVEALELMDQTRYRDTLIAARVGLLNQLGHIYRSLENYEAALGVLEEALTTTDKTTDSLTLLNNKANLYKDQEMYEQALHQYTLAYHTGLGTHDSLHLAMALDNMGGVLSKMMAPAALDTLWKALAIRKRHQEFTGLYASYKNLALHFSRQGLRDTALAYAEKARQTAALINSSTFRYDALQLLMQLNGDANVVAFNRLTDSLWTARQLAENKNAFIKYNLSEERKKTAQEALQKEKETRTKQLFQLSTVFILLLLVGSYFVFRYRYKKGKREEMYKTESRISKKVHDELANEVFHAMAFAEAKNLGDLGDKEKLLTSLDKIYAKTRNISKDHARIATGPDYPQHLKELLASYATDQLNVIVNGLDSIPWARVGDLKKMACYRVLQELMVNMKKHSEATLVLVKFQKEGSQIHVTYTDNGKGIAKGASLNRGGLQNAETRMEAVKGSFTFETRLNKGFKGLLSFPV